MTLELRWFDSGMEPTCMPDPAYPHGMEIDLSDGKTPTCSTDLPYPSRRIGHFMVECDKCGLTAAISTAGRPDDPRSVRLACKKRRH